MDIQFLRESVEEAAGVAEGQSSEPMPAKIVAGRRVSDSSKHRSREADGNAETMIAFLDSGANKPEVITGHDQKEIREELHAEKKAMQAQNIHMEKRIQQQLHHISKPVAGRNSGHHIQQPSKQ